MKRVMSIFVLIVCMMLTTVLPASAVESTLTEEQKMQNEIKISMEKQRVYDMADLFSDEDEQYLDAMMLSFSIEGEKQIRFFWKTFRMNCILRKKHLLKMQRLC